MLIIVTSWIPWVGISHSLIRCNWSYHPQNLCQRYMNASLGSALVKILVICLCMSIMCVHTWPSLMCSRKWWYFNASSSAPLLSSYRSAVTADVDQVDLYWTSGELYSILRIWDTSFTKFINGIKSCITCDRAMYSASVVLNATSVWSLDTHRIGCSAYIMT